MGEPKIIAPGITMDWEVMSGEPCIQGTRIPPWIVMGMFMCGDSLLSIAKGYTVTTDEIEAAIRYEYALAKSGKRRPRAKKPQTTGGKG